MNAPKSTAVADLIERLGGSAEVARKTGYSIQRINNWKVRGIPAEAKVEFPHLFWPEAVGGVSAASSASEGAQQKAA